MYKFLILIILFMFIKSEEENIYQLGIKENNYRHQKYNIRIQEPIEYIYADSKNHQFRIIYITVNKYVFDYKYMFWYIGKTKYPNSEGFKKLELSYITPEGESIALDKARQFKNLKKGLYYIIITRHSIDTGYASQFLNKPVGKLLSIRSFGNSFVVQKYNID